MGMTSGLVLAETGDRHLVGLGASPFIVADDMGMTLGLVLAETPLFVADDMSETGDRHLVGLGARPDSPRPG
jgi:hypothetical protein